jgi:aspartate dehydrogenase
MRLGVIGAGGMAETMLEGLAAELPEPLEHLAVLVRPGRSATAEALRARFGKSVAGESGVHETLESFLSVRPRLVAECAGHAAVGAYGPAVLAAGCDFLVVSVGALADDDLRARLETAAKQGGARLILATGAVGGLDALGAARLSGLESVVYTGSKPPRAWKGTKAESLLALDTIDAPAAFYEGTAREAAQLYPQNANVAAAVALAGAGFEATRVRLVADPGLTLNVHEIAVRATCANFTIRLEGRPSPANPKTSLTAGYSLARTVLNASGRMVVA